MASANGQPIAIQDRFSGTIGSTNNTESQLGDYCVAAELWPSQKLRNGTAAVSAALGAMLGSSPAGSVINLYQNSGQKDSMHQCSLVRLQLCSNSADIGAVSLGHRSSTADAPEAGSSGEQPSSASPNPATPLQRGRTGGSHATPPSMRGSAASQITPNLLGLPSKEPSSKKSSTGKKSGRGQKQRGGGSEAGSDNIGGQKGDIGSSVQLKVAQDLLKGEFQGLAAICRQSSFFQRDVFFLIQTSFFTFRRPSRWKIMRCPRSSGSANIARKVNTAR